MWLAKGTRRNWNALFCAKSSPSVRVPPAACAEAPPLVFHRTEIELGAEYEQIRGHSLRHRQWRGRNCDRRRHRLSICHSDRDSASQGMSNEDRGTGINLRAAYQGSDGQIHAPLRGIKREAILVVAMPRKIEQVGAESVPGEIRAEVGHHSAISGESMYHDHRTCGINARGRAQNRDGHMTSRHFHNSGLLGKRGQPDPVRAKQQKDHARYPECELYPLSRATR